MYTILSLALFGVFGIITIVLFVLSIFIRKKELKLELEKYDFTRRSNIDKFTMKSNEDMECIFG
jgi:Trk-type K+ transport system membrane component